MSPEPINAIEFASGASSPKGSNVELGRDGVADVPEVADVGIGMPRLARYEAGRSQLAIDPEDVGMKLLTYEPVYGTVEVILDDELVVVVVTTGAELDEVPDRLSR